MTMDLTAYRSIGKLTNWLIGLTIVSIVFAVISLTQSFQRFQGVTNQQPDNLCIVVGSIYTIVSVLLIITLLIWYYRATKNIQSFGARETTSPRMAIAWWFIPIVHLWKPYIVSQQIWKASDPKVKLTEGIEWRKVSSSNSIKIWWALGLAIIFYIVAIIFFSEINISLNNIDPETTEFPHRIQFIVLLVTILFLAVFIMSTVFFMRMIRQVSKWQDFKYTHLPD